MQLPAVSMLLRAVAIEDPATAAVLARLAMAAPQPVNEAALAALLGHHEIEQLLEGLRDYLAAVADQLPAGTVPAGVVREGDAWRLRLPQQAIDVLRFLALADSAVRAQQAGDTDEASRLARLAMALWRRDFATSDDLGLALRTLLRGARSDVMRLLGATGGDGGASSPGAPGAPTGGTAGSAAGGAAGGAAAGATTGTPTTGTSPTGAAGGTGGTSGAGATTGTPSSGASAGATSTGTTPAGSAATPTPIDGTPVAGSTSGGGTGGPTAAGSTPGPASGAAGTQPVVLPSTADGASGGTASTAAGVAPTTGTPPGGPASAPTTPLPVPPSSAGGDATVVGATGSVTASGSASAAPGAASPATTASQAAATTSAPPAGPQPVTHASAVAPITPAPAPMTTGVLALFPVRVLDDPGAEALLLSLRGDIGVEAVGPPPEGPAAPTAWAEAARAALERAGHSRAVVLGRGAGVLGAISLAKDHPELVARLVLDPGMTPSIDVIPREAAARATLTATSLALAAGVAASEVERKAAKRRTPPHRGRLRDLLQRIFGRDLQDAIGNLTTMVLDRGGRASSDLAEELTQTFPHARRAEPSEVAGWIEEAASEDAAG